VQRVSLDVLSKPIIGELRVFERFEQRKTLRGNAVAIDTCDDVLENWSVRIQAWYDAGDAGQYVGVAVLECRHVMMRLDRVSPQQIRVGVELDDAYAAVDSKEVILQWSHRSVQSRGSRSPKDRLSTRTGQLHLAHLRCGRSRTRYARVETRAFLRC
jgi:hypothetical protein